MTKGDQDVPELKREQLGAGVRGKYLKRFTQGSNVVVLQPEIQEGSNGPGSCVRCYDACNGRNAMNSTYTAVINLDADWWIGWIEEVPGVSCQESSRETLLKSLRGILLEAIELNLERKLATQ